VLVLPPVGDSAVLDADQDDPVVPVRALVGVLGRPDLLRFVEKGGTSIAPSYLYRGVGACSRALGTRRELLMISRSVTLPELGMIAGTRAALGAGVALLLGERLDRAPRRAVGWALLAVGALTTFPLLAGVLHSRTPSPEPAA